MKKKDKNNESFDESLIEAVYAGPEEMLPGLNSEADIEDVYAGPEEMDPVCASPENNKRFTVKESVTGRVYAGPGLMQSNGQTEEIFQAVYAGPPDNKTGFFSRLKEKLTARGHSDKPYPENYADDDPVIPVPEKDSPKTAEEGSLCPFCGSRNPASARFCSTCGASLKKEPPKANM